MKNLTQEECIEICEFIYPEIIWEYFDDITWEEGSPYHAIDGFLSLDVEAKSIAIYYENNEIIITDKTSKNLKEKRLDLQKIFDQVFTNKELNEKKISSSDEIKKMIFNKYVKKITDRFSTTVEYRMKDSVVLYNNEGLAYGDKIDLNLRVFVENDDFLNSKIVLALTYYAPEPGTGTILHESVADVMLDNKDVFKLDNEYSYSGLDYYGATGYKLEICNENLAKVSARIEQIQFYIDLATLIKIVNAKTFEIRYNKKWGYGGILSAKELKKFNYLYNYCFDIEKSNNQIEESLPKKNNLKTGYAAFIENLDNVKTIDQNNKKKKENIKKNEKIQYENKTRVEQDIVNRVKVDPVLKSKKNEEIERQNNLKKLFWYFIIYLGMALLIWLVKNC
jgi:hypothetical protein